MIRTGQSSVYSSLLGICPLLIPVKSTISGLILSLVVFICLLLSCVSVSLLRHYISHHMRVVPLLLVSACWVSVLDLFMQAYFHNLRLDFGIYLPLIAMNGIVMLSLQSVALESNIKQAATYAVCRGGVIIFLLCLVGSVRELLGKGGLLLDSQRYVHHDYSISLFQTGGFSIMQQAPGALMTLAFIFAASAAMTQSKSDKL